MGYHGSTKARQMRDYDMALHHYQSIKPIRGSDNLRPLAERNKQHVNIRMVGNDVVVRVYHTDIITYKPDDTIIINNGGFATQTTHEILKTISPFYVSGHDGQTWVRSLFVTPEGKKGRGALPLRDNTPEEFHSVDRNWVRSSPLFPVVHHMNRKEVNRVRGLYKSFVDYSIGLLKMLGEDGRFSRDTFKEALGYYHKPVIRSEELRQHILSEDTGDNFKALLSLLSPMGNHTTKAFRSAFNEWVIKAHADEVLEPETVYTGTFVTDRYKRYRR